MKVVISPTDIPAEPHLAIIIFGSIHVPGDERSRTNPGHGYPAHTEHKMTYYIYEDRGEWENEISVRTRRGDKQFVALSVRRPTVRTHVTVSIDDG